MKTKLNCINPSFESDYISSMSTVTKPYMFSLVLINLGVGLYHHIQNDHSAPLIIIGINVGLVLFMICSRGLRSLFDLISLISCAVFFMWNLNIRKDNFVSQTRDTAFLQGYNFGLIHQLFLRGYSRIELIIVIEICITIAKIIYLEDVSTETLVNQVIIDFVLFAVRIAEEVNLRVLYQKLDQSHKSLTKFKELLATKLPSSLIIISRELNKKFFSNQTFDIEFELDKHDMTCLEKLQEIKLDPDDKESDGHELFKKCSSPSLMDYLWAKVEDTAHDFTGIQNCIYLNDNAKKVTYEANIFSFLWDGKDAIAVILSNITHQTDILTLKIANSNKEKAISIVSHELRNPVNGLMGMVKIMQKQNKDPSIQKSLDLLKITISLLLNILNSILDIQQINANKLRLNISKINLMELLYTIQMLFQFQCVEKGLEFRLEIDKNVPKYIKTDKDRLSQILINLCTNAIKFTMKGGVTLGVKVDSQDPRKLVFSVADTGIGIKKEDLGKLFKIFGKLEASTEFNQQGVGLGLVISNSLVGILKGDRLTVESEESKGSTFTFKLPIDFYQDFAETEIPDEAVEDSLAIPDTKNYSLLSAHSNKEGSTRHRYTKSLQTHQNTDFLSVPLALETTGKHVLLVDDNPFNLLVTKHLIEDLRIPTVLAHNGVEAINKVEQCYRKSISIALILMDCEMPVMDGRAATQILKQKMAQGEIPEIPIVGLSGHDTEEYIQECYNVGMSDYIKKPVSEGNLLKMFKQYNCIE